MSYKAHAAYRKMKTGGKIAVCIAAALLIIFLVLAFMNPIMYSYYKRTGIYIDVKYDMRSAVSLNDGDESAKTISGPSCFETADGIEYIASDGKSFTVKSTENCKLFGAYEKGDYCYFVFRGVEEFNLPLNSKTHTYDRLVRLNTKNGTSDEVKTDENGWILYAGDSKTLVFNVSDYSIYILFGSENKEIVYSFDKTLKYKRFEFRITDTELEFSCEPQNGEIFSSSLNLRKIGL